MKTKQNERMYIALLTFYAIPILYQFSRIYFINNVPDTNTLSIAGQIEWFGLIYESLQALLITPMYYLLSEVVQDKQKFINRFWQLFGLSSMIFAIFAIIIIVNIQTIIGTIVTDTTLMTQITHYTTFEMIGFFFANMISVITIGFLLLSDKTYFYSIVLLETILKILADTILIPKFGADGIAYSNISTYIIMLIYVIYLCKKRDMFHYTNSSIDFLPEFLKIGIFSGSNIILTNVVYGRIICKMVNNASEQGNYWIANTFIWSFLLLPATALFELIKKNGNKYSASYYIPKLGMISLSWLLSYPLWNFILVKLLKTTNPMEIKSIIMILVPFYIAYLLSGTLDSIFTTNGKTYLSFISSAVVNLLYYPIMLMYYNHTLDATNTTIKFICLLFGFGILCNTIFNVLLYLLFVKKSKKLKKRIKKWIKQMI